eukprot:PITA_23532
MAINELQQRRINLVTTLCQEGILDEHFTQLQQLQDEINPDFVQEVISLFFEDSQKMLNTLQNTLNQEPVDYKKVDSCLNHFKGSSSSIGAQRVKNVCTIFRACCEEKMKTGCLQCLQELKQEYYLLKDKLEILLKLEQQIRRAGGNICVAN